MDCGGYFIIKGSEKTVLGQERAAENRIYCFDGKNTTKWSGMRRSNQFLITNAYFSQTNRNDDCHKNNGFGNGLYDTHGKTAY